MSTYLKRFNKTMETLEKNHLVSEQEKVHFPKESEWNCQVSNPEKERLSRLTKAELVAAKGEVKIEEIMILGSDNIVVPVARIFGKKNKIIPEIIGEGITIKLEEEEDIIQKIFITTKKISEKKNDQLLILKNEEQKIFIYITTITVEFNVPDPAPGEDKRSWKLGAPGVSKRILPVNYDGKTIYELPQPGGEHPGGPFKCKDMPRIDLLVQGPDISNSGYEFRLFVSDTGSERIRVFTRDILLDKYFKVIGPGAPIESLSLTEVEGKRINELYCEGLKFANKEFTGFVTLRIALVHVNEDPIWSDFIVMRIPPFVMTPTSNMPEILYMATFKGIGSDPGNEETVKDIEKLIEKIRNEFKKQGKEYPLKIKLVPMQNTISSSANLIINGSIFQEDRWFRDEMKFGYQDVGENEVINVVLEGERDRVLGDWVKTLYGPYYSYIKPEKYGTPAQKLGLAPPIPKNSLDSFGNLAITPPLENYPFGRAMVGSAHPSVPLHGRRMMDNVTDFLYAQTIQSPLIHLYSDWLLVGHIDEFQAIVPKKDGKFVLVLASTDKAYEILKERKRQGHGDEILFKTQFRDYPKGNKPCKTTVNELLDPENEEFLLFAKRNSRYQSCINWNREVLKNELQISENDIIDVPALYEQYDEMGHALDYFPGAANLIVPAPGYVGVPKSFYKPFEDAITTGFEKHGIDVTFINTWYPYFLQMGEIHCGTNFVRSPFKANWWNPPKYVDYSSLNSSR